MDLLIIEVVEGADMPGFATDLSIAIGDRLTAGPEKRYGFQESQDAKRVKLWYSWRHERLR